MVETSTQTDPEVVVRNFLDALQSGSTSAVADLVADDVWWTNVGLPTVKGKKAVIGAIAALNRNMHLGIRTHNLAVSAPANPTDPRSPHVVLTERTDSLSLGRFRCDFWVCGRIEVRDGRVIGWLDYFSTTNMVRGTIRGLVGIIPGLGRR